VVVTTAGDLEALCSETGLDRDVSALMRDEHDRYRFYIQVIALAPPPEDAALLNVVLRDPDPVMGESAAIQFVAKKAGQHSSYAAFTSWAQTVSDITSDRDFLSRRIREWSEFKRIMEGGSIGDDFFDASSDWLQRKLSEELMAEEPLAKLAELGRTKRIRNTSQQRLRDIGRHRS
jgi:hypothetical protein